MRIGHWTDSDKLKMSMYSITYSKKAKFLVFTRTNFPRGTR